MANKDSYARSWTRGAVECYERGCVCQGCLLYEQLGKKCQMKRSVFELVRKFGAPNAKKKQSFSDYEQNILDAILSGCNSFEEIGKRLNKKQSAIGGMVRRLYKKAIDIGWNPIRKGIVNKSLMPQFLKFVRSGGFEG